MTQQYILNHAHAMQDQMVAWRRDIHMHPELGFEEVRTANIVADELRRLGMEVEVGVGITGVVGHLGEGGPVIGIRADMDALPIQEANEVAYASQVPGKMHACGHDAHTAMLLGVANILNTMPDRPKGEIRFIFQPSEESQDHEDKSGAMRMVEESALDGVDNVLALHINSTRASGQVRVTPGIGSAAVDMFYAKIKGRGAHGAMPHEGVDPIFIMAQIINAVNGIVARRVNPINPAVISFGGVHGGKAPNVIPAEIDINGTMRSFDHETRVLLREQLKKAFQISRSLGGDYDLRIQYGYPPMQNDPAVTALIEQVTGELFSPDDVVHEPAMMGAEDFSYMQEQAPGMMFSLGAKLDDEVRLHHNPTFDIDEAVFPKGAAILAEAACRLLRQNV